MSISGLTLPNSDEILDSWLNSATEYAQNRGYTFDPNCLTDLTQLLRDAATRLRASNEEAAAPSHIPDVQRLVLLMIQDLTVQFPEDTVLHEWTMINARTKLCPLFPIC